MLAMSQRLNPECEHIPGDMRTLRLGRTFSVVFIHDAIDYMTTPADLHQALETAFQHCQPGGLTLIVPDAVRETFEPTTEHGGTDDGDRGLRYLEWVYDPDERDTSYITEYVCLLRQAGQPVRVEHDQHQCGLFSREVWMQTLQAIGFSPQALIDPYERVIFLGRKLV